MPGYQRLLKEYHELGDRIMFLNRLNELGDRIYAALLQLESHFAFSGPCVSTHPGNNSDRPPSLLVEMQARGDDYLHAITGGLEAVTYACRLAGWWKPTDSRMEVAVEELGISGDERPTVALQVRFYVTALPGPDNYAPAALIKPIPQQEV
jgi:hypothetical protein